MSIYTNGIGTPAQTQPTLTMNLTGLFTLSTNAKADNMSGQSSTTGVTSIYLHIFFRQFIYYKTNDMSNDQLLNKIS